MCRREAACKEANFLANKTTHSLFDEGKQARTGGKICKTGWSFLYRKGIPRILQILQINISCVTISFFTPWDYKGVE